MTFITLSNTRVKVGAVINYVATSQLEGTSTVFVINIWQATQFATAFTQVSYATQAARDADLARLDAAVNAFVEPLPSIYLSGNLNVHNTTLPFYTNLATNAV